MLRTVRISIALVMLIALFVAACSLTTLTSSWKDPSYQGQPRKIMVIGVAKKALNKRIIEDEFVRQLKRRGTDAFASYTVMPDDKQSDNAAIAAKMKEQGADAVLISRLARKKTVYVQVPGTVTYRPAYYGNWRDYYGYGYESVYTPGYTAEDTYAVMETNLYDAGKDDLIWSASSETEIWGSNQDQIRSYINVMVNNMADHKLVKQE